MVRPPTDRFTPRILKGNFEGTFANKIHIGIALYPPKRVQFLPYMNQSHFSQNYYHLFKKTLAS